MLPKQPARRRPVHIHEHAMTALQAAPSPSALQKNTPDSAANSAPDTPSALQLACRSEAGTAALVQRLARGLQEAVAGWARSVGREEERYCVTTLGQLRDAELDMFCTAVVGNIGTTVMEGRMVTPREYQFGVREEWE